MQITQIQQAKKNENRVNVFLDDQFWIGIDKDELLQFELYRGKEIDDFLKREIEKSSSTTKLLNKTINYIQIRPRSVKEIKDYLQRKRIDPETSNVIIEKLQSKNLLSDEYFTNWYIENKLASGRYGEIRIKSELYKKGISKTLIEKGFAEILTEETKENIEMNANQYAKKAARSIKAKDAYEFKSKLIKKLMSRGYSYTVAKNAANEENWSIQ